MLDLSGTTVLPGLRMRAEAIDGEAKRTLIARNDRT